MFSTGDKYLLSFLEAASCQVSFAESSFVKKPNLYVQ